MKILVIYYSLTGHTRHLALAIAREIDADTLELEMKKDIKGKKGFRKFFWGGIKVLFREKPELLPFDKNLTDYDLLFIGTPVWAGSYNPTLRTFFKKADLRNKKIALFCSYEVSGDGAIQKMKSELAGNEVVDVVAFKNAKAENDKGRANNANRVSEWARKVVKRVQENDKSKD